MCNIVSPSLKDNVVGTNALSNSVEWKFRDEIEWSVDVETEFFIESFSFSLCLLVKIKDLPSLVSTVVFSVSDDLLSFKILALEDIEASVSFLNVAEMLSLIGKDLEPS